MLQINGSLPRYTLLFGVATNKWLFAMLQLLHPPFGALHNWLFAMLHLLHNGSSPCYMLHPPFGVPHSPCLRCLALRTTDTVTDGMEPTCKCGSTPPRFIVTGQSPHRKLCQCPLYTANIGAQPPIRLPPPKEVGISASLHASLGLLILWESQLIEIPSLG